jgi:hypothetical protein
LNQQRKQRGMERDTIPPPKPFTKLHQPFTYPIKSFAEFLYHERTRQLHQCPTNNTPWNTSKEHAKPPKPRPCHPQTRSYIASPSDAQHPKTNPRRHDTQIQRQKQNDSWGEITQLF